jgi:hypothetical protein
MLEFVKKLMHIESGIDHITKELEYVEEAQKLQHYLDTDDGHDMLKTYCAILHDTLISDNLSIKRIVFQFISDLTYSSGPSFVVNLSKDTLQLLFQVKRGIKSSPSFIIITNTI